LCFKKCNEEVPRGKEAIMASTQGMRAFVISARLPGEGPTAMPMIMGTEVATSVDLAWQQAINRWPNLVIMRPELRDGLTPRARMLALEGDDRLGARQRTVGWE